MHMIDFLPDYILLGVGLVILLGSAELLVHQATKLAGLLGTSNLFIGLTITAFGTSLPELAVGISGQLSRNADVGLGNIIGSNIFNVLFVLGLAAVIRPIIVQRSNIRRDIPIILATCILFFIMAMDGNIGTVEAFLLILILAGYLYYTFRIKSSQEEKESGRGDSSKGKATQYRIPIIIGLTIISIALIIISSNWIVTGASGIAGRFGMSQFVIGLTVVAVGTSLPEIATSIAAVRQGNFDLAVGNVLGSCFFNIVAVPMAMTLVSSLPLTISSEAVWVDIPFMILALVACMPVFISGHRISRSEGVLYLFYYTLYAVMLYFRGIPGSFLSRYKVELGILALPIMIITIVILFVRTYKVRGRTGHSISDS